MSTGNIIVTGGNVRNVPQVIWNVPPNLSRSGAEWYVGNVNKTVVFAQSETMQLAVCVQGELKIDIVSKGHDHYGAIYNATDLEQWGITNDETLDEFVTERKRFVYVNNPWFEVFDANDSSGAEGLYITHDIFDAVQFAIDYLMGAR